MNKTLITLAVIIGGFLLFALIVVGTLVGSYNSMVRERTDVETTWGQVETQYQRRFDLVPQLVGAVKGTLAQEQAVFGAIAEARTRYAGTAPGSEERVAATSQFEGALARLLVVMENYPVLQSDGTVRMLMDELSGTANRVNVAQQRYNESVQVYNTHIRSFPATIIAGWFGFKEKPFFTSEEGANKAPTVDLQVGPTKGGNTNE